MSVFARAWRKVRHLITEMIGKRRLRSLGVEFGEGLTLYGVPVVSMTKSSHIKLGRRIVLCSWSIYTALGVSHPVVLRTLEPGAELVVGDGCWHERRDRVCSREGGDRPGVPASKRLSLKTYKPRSKRD